MQLDCSLKIKTSYDFQKGCKRCTNFCPNKNPKNLGWIFLAHKFFFMMSLKILPTQKNLRTFPEFFITKIFKMAYKKFLMVDFAFFGKLFNPASL